MGVLDQSSETTEMELQIAKLKGCVMYWSSISEHLVSLSQNQSTVSMFEVEVDTCFLQDVRSTALLWRTTWARLDSTKSIMQHTH